MRYTTQREIRRAFWETYPNLPHRYYVMNSRYYLGKPAYEYPTDTRCAFGAFIDDLARNGEISEKLAFRATL